MKHFWGAAVAAALLGWTVPASAVCYNNQPNSPDCRAMMQGFEDTKRDIQRSGHRAQRAICKAGCNMQYSDDQDQLGQCLSNCDDE